MEPIKFSVFFLQMFIRILTPVNDVYEQRYAINSAEKNTWEGGGGQRVIRGVELKPSVYKKFAIFAKKGF